MYLMLMLRIENLKRYGRKKYVYTVNGIEIEIKDILHVPDLSVNLLSVSKMVKRGNSVLFDKNGCTIKNANNEIVAQCKEENGVYPLYEDAGTCMNTVQADDAFLWHRKLGHINFNAMKKMRDGPVLVGSNQ